MIREINSAVARYAILLTRTGVRKGDRVAILLPKGVEFLFVHLANLAVGTMTVPLNPAYTDEEVTYFLSDSGTLLLITDRERFTGVEIIVKRIKGMKILLTDAEGPDGSLPLLASVEKMEDRGRRDFPAGGDDGAMVCYTSGTTGRSRGR